MNEKKLFNEICVSMALDLHPYLKSHRLDSYPDSYPDYKSILSSDPNLSRQNAVAIAMQSHFTRKYVGEREVSLATEAMRAKAAWDSFLSDNDRCKRQNEKLRNGESLGDMSDLILNEAVRIFDDLFFKALDDDECELLLTKGGHHLVPRAGFSTGPGVCNATVFEKHSNRNVHDKYSSGLCVSTERGVGYLNYLARVAPWFKGLPTTFVVEPRINAITVPKSDVIDRLIGPCNNGDLLLSYPAEAFLTRMYRHAGMLLRDLQPIHRALSKTGSRMRASELKRVLAVMRGLGDFNGGFLSESEGATPCTIDLRGASNCVGYELVKRFCPPPLFDYLDTFRPQEIAYNGQVVKIEAMALMGNAYCFPLQTLIFWCLAKACLKLYGAPKGFVSVFGDDIIVPKQAYNRVIHVLESLFMVVNSSKSFSEGLFRESCGGDFYDGYNVKPVQFAGLRSVSDRYTLINALIEHGTTHNILYKRTIQLLCDSIPARHRRCIPCDFDMSWGIRIPEAILSQMESSWRSNISIAVVRQAGHLLGNFQASEDFLSIGRNSYTHYRVTVPQVKPATLLRSAKKLRMFDILRCKVPVDYRGEEGVDQVILNGPEGKFSVNGNRSKVEYRTYDIPWWDAPSNGDSTSLSVRDLSLITCYMYRVFSFD